MDKVVVAERPGLKVKWIYALGQFGWSLTSFGVLNLLNLFYFPPEDGNEALFPSFIYAGAILGVLTTLGVINFGGRLFDGITDPLIANWSDRTKHKMGKRKFMMALAVIPFALFSVLVFYPLSVTNFSLNTSWLFITLFLFYLAMTVYVVPYTALIGELGHHPDDRLSLSTIISVTWALGFLVGNMVHGIHASLKVTYGTVEAFQYIIAGFAVLGFLAMLIPIFFLNENKYARQSATENNVFSALRTVFKNRNFLVFASSDLFYWLSLTFIQSGVSYFIIVLMGRPQGDASLFLVVGFLFSLLLYYPLNILAKKYTKKRILLYAFLCFATIFLLTANYQLLGTGNAPFYLLALASAFPLAAFGIIPNAIIADVIYEDENDNSQELSGMYYGARNFTMKLGIALANLIFPSLLIFGKSTDQPLGVQLVAYAAFVFCLVGWFIFRFYGKNSSSAQRG